MTKVGDGPRGSEVGAKDSHGRANKGCERWRMRPVNASFVLTIGARMGCCEVWHQLVSQLGECATWWRVPISSLRRSHPTHQRSERYEDVVGAAWCLESPSPPPVDR